MEGIQLVGSANAAPRQYDGARPYLAERGHLANTSSEVLCPAIGEVFGDSIDLSELLDNTAEAESKLRDLAVRVSERGVCFFSNQTLTYEDQKELVVRMSHLTGSPQTSSLHIHPVVQSDGGKKFEVSNKIIEEHGRSIFPSLFANRYWHVDATFEHVGPAYSCLKLLVAPEGGGDTLWCSLYDCCDKLSPSFLAYLETLTADHDASWYLAVTTPDALRLNRGSPENSDKSLRATHPVIVTHPVTGWKALNVNRAYTKHINGLTQEESDLLLDYLFRIISDNHDLQVRHRWKASDVALWDNRSCAHCVTNDYKGKQRYGLRTLSSGERSVFNPASKTKKESKEGADRVNGASHANGVNGASRANGVSHS